MPQPLALSDSQLEQIMRLAKPLHPACRDAFLRSVAARLQGQEVVPGIVSRACSELQHEFFDPPQLQDPGMHSKWR
jgi:hypothetical protein